MASNLNAFREIFVLVVELLVFFLHLIVLKLSSTLFFISVKNYKNDWKTGK